MLSTVRVDTPVNRSFLSYKNLVNSQTWHSCQESELTTVAFKATYDLEDAMINYDYQLSEIKTLSFRSYPKYGSLVFPTTIGADKRSL